MHYVGIFEAKNELSKLIQRVERGEDVTITRHGEEVAVITAAKKARAARGREALEQLRELFKEQPLGTFEELMAWKNEGRR